MWHVRRSDRRGHCLPMNLRGFSTTRARDCWPPPHVRLQTAHFPHMDTAQSWGQPFMLHGRACFSEKQWPPLYALRFTVRMRSCFATWQPAAHSDHSLHALSLQSSALWKAM